MNCPKCNTPIKPGAKFCTKCGTRVVEQTQDSQYNSQHLSSHQQDDNDTTEDLKKASQRIFWNILPGQVARVIRENEFEQYGKIQGIIVAEGTTAYIRANGRTVASISGGSYDFIDKRGIGGTMSDAISSVGNTLRKGWQIIVDLFKSRRKTLEDYQEVKEEDLIAACAQQQRDIFAKAKEGAAFSVVILLNRAFPILIGAKQLSLDAYAQFEPMTIHTRHLDMKIGLNAYFRIKDHEQFIRHYLLDKQSLNTAIITDEITDSVRNTIQDILYNQDFSSNRIPDMLRSTIKEKLNEVAKETFFGLEIVRIVEISAENEDLKRFSDLSREMYLSEQELDYLKRSNDFKNRLADVNNSQRIQEARNDVELQQRLNEVNKDQLLNEDEMNRFVTLLDNERKLRDARTTEEREAALAEIEKTRLIRNDDLATLRAQCEQQSYRRGSILQMMQLKDCIEFERIRMQGENEQLIEKAKTELHIQQLYKDHIATNRQRDADFDFQQRKRNADLIYEQQRRVHELEMEEDRTQHERLIAMMRAEEQNKENERKYQATIQAQQQAHDENMARIQGELTPEQILAMNGGEAAVEFARSYTARNNIEIERAANERLNEEHRRNSDMMYELMNRMLDNQAAQANMQAQQVMYQQQRADGAYNQSLNYTTRQPDMRQMQTLQQEQYHSNIQPNNEAQYTHKKNQATDRIFCPSCGAEITAGESFCPECGENL